VIQRVIQGTSESVSVVFQSFQKMADVLIRLRICLNCGEEENKTKQTHHYQPFAHNHLLSGSSVTL